MGNSALKSHLETSQKTGVFQLTEKGLLEVRGQLIRAETDASVPVWRTQRSEMGLVQLFKMLRFLTFLVSRGAAAVDGEPADSRSVWEQD